jgi:hypothetical protein
MKLSKEFGIAGQVTNAYEASDPDSASAEGRLVIAWAKIKEREADIVRFSDNKVTPHGAQTLPSIQELRMMNGDKNSIDHNAVRVVFSDGSGLTLHSPTYEHDPAIDWTVYPKKAHHIPTP